MKMNGQEMIKHIHALVAEGHYKEAYDYSMSADCIEEECRQNITCFRYLLGCINGESPEQNSFSFTNDPQAQPVGMEQLKYQMDVKCRGQIFDELRQLCRQFN